MGCIPADSLVDFLRGQGSDAQREGIAAHLATGCQECSRRQRWLSEVLHLTSQDDSFEFSEAVIARVIAQFKGWVARDRTPLRQMIAQLIFDSFFPGTLAEARDGSSSSASRQMLFRVDGYDIDLRFELSEAADGEDLIGQIMAEDQARAELAPMSVELQGAHATPTQTLTNARGIFRFNSLPPGIYNIKLHVPEGEIHLERVASAMGA